MLGNLKPYQSISDAEQSKSKSLLMGWGGDGMEGQELRSRGARGGGMCPQYF